MDATASRDALVERLFQAAIATFDLYGVYLGDRLGLYRALADRGPSTSAELADAAGINERYAREWLEQQAATGILEVEDTDAAPEQRRFVLPPGHDEVLLDETSLSFAASLAQSAVVYAPADELVDAFRSGEGLTSERFGPDAHLVQARSTRPLFEHLLGGEWLPAIPDVHDRLAADPPARVADVMSRAIHAATSGIPGPVVISLPEDVLSEPVDLPIPSPHGLMTSTLSAVGYKRLLGAGRQGFVATTMS